MNIWYRFALLSGMIPLALGVGIFALWLATRASWLEIAGALNISMGLVFLLTGFACWIVYMAQSWRTRASWLNLRSWVPLLVLLMNFPVAVSILNAVEYVHETCTLVVENRSSQDVKGLRLIEREKVYPVGIVPSGGRIARDFHFQYEGSVLYAFELNGKISQGVAFGYVSGGFGSTSKMVIKESGEVTVEERVS